MAGLAEAIDIDTAAVVLEVVQGENGVVPAPEPFVWCAARGLSKEFGALLWVDEVQAGLGRCGRMFAHQDYGVRPDLVTVAKGLGNGFPIGACLATGRAADFFHPGMHGSTFGGNSVAAAAGLAVLDQLEAGLIERSKEIGKWLAEQISAVDHPRILEVRGAGLLFGVVLRDDGAAEVAKRALAEGFIINALRPNVLRLAPALTISRNNLTSFLNILPELLDQR